MAKKIKKPKKKSEVSTLDDNVNPNPPPPPPPPPLEPGG